MSKRKACVVCQRVKPLVDFYRASGMTDGYYSKCKDCYKAAVKARKLENLERYQAYDRQRGTLPHRLAAVAAYRQTEHGKELLNEASKAWAVRNPLKRKAHIWVGNAIRDGRLFRGPCEICGSEKVTATTTTTANPQRFAGFVVLAIERITNLNEKRCAMRSERTRVGLDPFPIVGRCVAPSTRSDDRGTYPSPRKPYHAHSDPARNPAWPVCFSWCPDLQHQLRPPQQRRQPELPDMVQQLT